MIDLDLLAGPKPRVLFATPGKDADPVGCFGADLTGYRGDPAAIRDICCDVSAAFLAGGGMWRNVAL